MKNRIKEFSKCLVVAIVSIMAYEFVKPNSKPSTTPISNICMDYDSNTISELPVLLIQDMANKYNTTQLKAIKEGLVKDLQNQVEKGELSEQDFQEQKPLLSDAQSIWFDLETLKEFLYHIEHITKTKDNTITSDKLGVRIYYAAYPESNMWDNQKNYEDALLQIKDDPIAKNYGKKHTLVMIPTIRRIFNGSVGNFDFNPLYDKSTYNIDLKTAILESEIKSVMASPSFKHIGNGIGSTAARNHGGLIPPRKPVDGELAFSVQ